MREAAVTTIGRMLRKIPRATFGKTRLATTLLAPFGSAPAVVEGAFGLRYHCPSLAEPIIRGIICDGLYEPATHEAICAHLPEGGVFLDIGANIGAVSLPVARARPDIDVFAIEASPAIASYLIRNIALNAATSVTVLNTFVGAEEGSTIEFFAAPSEKFGMGSAGPQFGVEPQQLTVRTIDAMLAEDSIGHPDVIKLDIEGAEFLALKGCETLLTSARRPRAVIFEFADWAEVRLGLRPGASQELMLASGYRLYDLARPGVALDRPMKAGGAMLLALA